MGWQQQGDTLSLAADAPLGPLQAAASRLRRLADKKGHSGEAVAVRPAGEDGSRPPSPYYGTPGFQYQEQVSGCCGRGGGTRGWGCGEVPGTAQAPEMQPLEALSRTESSLRRGLFKSGCSQPSRAYRVACYTSNRQTFHCSAAATWGDAAASATSGSRTWLTIPPLADFPLLCLRPPHQRRQRAAVDTPPRVASWGVQVG